MLNILVLLCLAGVGSGWRLHVHRSGPQIIGRPFPVTMRSLVVQGPRGTNCPCQWQWLELAPIPDAKQRWARICFLADHPGKYHLLPANQPSPQPQPQKPLPDQLPTHLLCGETPFRGTARNIWTGPVCRVRQREGWGAPGLGLYWTITSWTFANGDGRLELELVRMGKADKGLPAITLPLPANGGRPFVRRGSGQPGEAGWLAIPANTTIKKGEAHLARLLLTTGKKPPAGLRWGLPPGGVPNQLCRIHLPGGPKVLLPPGIIGYQRQEMALDRKLRKLVKEMTSGSPRDLGDLRDQKGEWLNLEYDLPWALVLHYLRHGDPLFLAAALAGADHVTTTDRCCGSSEKWSSGFPLVHGLRHRSKGAETGHVWLQGITAVALLTGDRRLLSRASETAHALAAAVQGRGMLQISRCLGWSGLACHTWSALTPDPLTTWASKRIRKTVCDSWDQEVNAFLLAGESVAPGVQIIPLWVQAGLLAPLTMAMEKPDVWRQRCLKLLYRKGVCVPASLRYCRGKPIRPGNPAPTAWQGLALEGTAASCGSQRRWQQAANRYISRFAREIKNADARKATLLARSWPLIQARAR